MQPRSAACGVIIVAVSVSAWGAPTIINGDLNGTVGTNTAPDGWDAAQATPDLADANGPYNNTGTPWNLSPNGGTFSRMNGVGDNRSEAISQTVGGLDVGEMYRIDMHVTNLGYHGPPWRGEDGVIEVYDGLSLIGTSQTLTKAAGETDPLVWEEASFLFTASSTSIDLVVKAETLGSTGFIAYLAVDGVSIAVVPTPGGLMLLGVGGLLTGRRRR